MKTMNYQAPGTGTRRTADQAAGASLADDASPAQASLTDDAAPAPAPEAPFPIQVIPWLVPALALLVVLTTGLIWATVL